MSGGTMSLKTKFLQWAKTPVFWAIAIALVYAAAMMFITIHLLHDSFHSTAFDLGVFTQEFKNTLQGKILYSPAIGGSQFVPHFSPVLFLLVPIYWIFPHAQMLLVVQSLLLAFGGYMIYVIARDYNFSPRGSLILEGLYFLNPLLWGVALFDFHTESFVIPALLVMFLGLRRKNWLFFSLGLLFILASKEDVVLTLGIFGFILIIFDYWQHKKVRKTSIIIFISAILTYGMGVLVSRLALAGEPVRMLSYLSNRYEYVGKPLSVAIPMVTSTIFSSGSLFLIGAYLAPFAALPLLSPEWVIPGLIVLLSGILSTNPGQHSELMQYPAAALPFLFMAFIEALPKIQLNKQIKLFMKRTNNRAFVYSIVFLVIISWLIISDGRIQIASLPDEHDAAINQVIALVPDNVTVTASNEIFPHLCSRTDVYLNATEGKLIAPGAGITKTDWGFPDKNTEYVIIDTRVDKSFVINTLVVSGGYVLLTTIDGVRLYRVNE